MKKYLGIVLIGVSGACLFLSGRLFAQIYDQNAPQLRMTLQVMFRQELQLMLQDLRKQKEKLIAENLPMTESEAVKSWAVYQKSRRNCKRLNEKFEMIHSDALPGKKTATFFQFDQRIIMMINLEIASQLPLLHGTAGQGHTNASIQ